MIIGMYANVFIYISSKRNLTGIELPYLLEHKEDITPPFTTSTEAYIDHTSSHHPCQYRFIYTLEALRSQF
jgi:hypothetical protein